MDSHFVTLSILSAPSSSVGLAIPCGKAQTSRRGRGILRLGGPQQALPLDFNRYPHGMY